VGSDASATVRLGGACPRLSQAAALPARASGGRLQGDVDGDGIRDHVFVRSRESAAPNCRYMLIVTSRAHTWQAPIRQQGLEEPGGAEAGRVWPSLSLPDVHALLRFAGDDGLTVSVTTWVSASGVYVGLFKIVGGALVRLHVERVSPPDTFSYGGSLSGISAVDCDQRSVVFSQAVRTSHRWHVARRKFTLTGETLRDGRGVKFVHAARLPAELRTQQGNGAAFGSCAVARNLRVF